MAETTGLSVDTLRWYEREGLFPRVERDPNRRRRYTARHVRLLQMLVRLRRTGMPTKEVRQFSRLLGEGPSTHPERLAMLAAHRDRIVAQLAELQGDLAVLDEKVALYRQLIAQGLDCNGAPSTVTDADLDTVEF
ncbi:DNA-binding transcriptional regulator, MerR family [Streptacidiphilus jiangxiensis]|uniref:DNA-binding transcriptional regulator, MerR family n=1 Tax=Streptacidiphilus jiangxiensis TaxID=235985 RepID=A0A1H7Q5G1_STRJI|nr:DNA-binding transcriptional regulator, MerR family [Streptacidiphilus jiangxiensis]